MNAVGTLTLIIIILIPVTVIAFLVIRMNHNQWLYLQSRVPEFDGSPLHGLEAEASVISKKETLPPNADDIAKVNLQVEIHLPGKAPYQISTCWLVEINSLDQVMPGKKLPVKVDPKKPMRVFPNVPWARLWGSEK